jgi:ABC-type Mn2+/Zn2+ transport system permease subunit
MVSALILIPAASAKLLAHKFSEMLPLSMLFSLTSAIIGIFASYVFNIPSGATIVIVAGLGFFMLVGYKLIEAKSAKTPKHK